jgi:DNA-binding NarL/FixJ family response regulator
MPPELESLTPRELEVFRHIASGRSNAEIAKLLYVTDETVKTHTSRVFMKLGVRDRTQAVILAYEQGIVEPAARSAP